MSRGIDSTNQTHVEGAHVHPVIMVNLQYDTPAYVHSGIGTITYDSNDYIGVGDFGSIDTIEESEDVTPSHVRLRLSGIDSQFITDALTAGRFGDAVTIYLGFRNDDNSLIADPEQIFSGIYEHASITIGDSSDVIVTLQSDLLMLNDKDGRRFTDEDQQSEYSGDTFFQYIADMIEIRLLWGGRIVGANDRGGDQYPTDGGERFDT